MNSTFGLGCGTVLLKQAFKRLAFKAALSQDHCDCTAQAVFFIPQFGQRG